VAPAAGSGTYTTATGSSTPRTLGDRAADAINVKDFGAIGDALVPSCQGVMAASSATLTLSCGAFAAADVTEPKTVVISGAGAGGAALTALITGYTSGTQVTLATPATYAVGSATLAISAVVTTAQSGSGSYAPGDPLTVAGGTAATAAVFPITYTQAVSATVVSSGSTVMTGACTVVGTTGHGSLFSFSGTISGGGLSGPLTLVAGGAYSTNPTTLTAEPVTGCGLTGATVSVVMGAAFVGPPTAPGNYSSQPSSPVATTTSGSGTGATLTPVWATSGSVDYGHDDTAAINAALTYARTHTSSPGFGGDSGPYANIVFPQSRSYLVTSALNFTGLIGYSFAVDGAGATIACEAGGAICIDALGSRWLKFHNLTVQGGTANTPNIGIQIGRTNTTALNSSDSNSFSDIIVEGAFQLAGFYNFSSESLTTYNLDVYNNLSSVSSYALIQDGYNHFNAQSTFITESAPVDTAQSFIGDTFIDVKAVHFGLGNAIWIGNAYQHNFIGSYGVSSGGYGVVLWNSTGNNNLLYFDKHLETTGLTDDFFFTGPSATPIVTGFTFRNPNDLASNSVFKADTNITSVVLRDAAISIGTYQSGTKLFDNAALWTVTGDYTSQAITQFAVPASWSGNFYIGQTHSLAQYGTSGAPGLSVQMPDSTATGGNPRGLGSVDLQSSRSGAQFVASGLDCALLGGTSSQCTGFASVAAGNIVSAQGTAATVFGQQNNALGTYSSIPGGRGASDFVRVGMRCFASNYFVSIGDDQDCDTVLSVSTSGSTAVTATADTTAANAYNCDNIAANTSAAIIAVLIANDITTPSKSYAATWGGGSIAPHILSKGSTQSTTLLDGVTTAISPDSTRSNGTVTGIAATLGADTTNGCLHALFTPPTGNTDTWHAAFHIEGVE
jgi:hypothetical protein